MGSSNILPWDQSQTNMDDDPTYLADTQRVDGGIDGVEFPSKTFNKLALQTSGVSFAVGQFLASKGFTITDSDLWGIVAALQSLFANVPGRTQLLSVTYSPLVTLNVGVALGFELTLAGNVALTITGLNAGDTVLLFFIQNSAGSHTITWPSNTSGFGQPDPNPNTLCVMVGKVSADLILRSSAPAMTATGINNTAIGQDAAAPGTFTNVVVSGSLTAPTPASSDNSTEAATTAWCKFGFAVSIGVNGYLKLPTWLGGLLLEWGTANSASSSQSITFPRAFGNVFSVVCTPLNYGPNAGRASPYLNGLTTTGFTQTSAGSTNSIFWFAVGN